jgi:hypothetical protein
MNSARLHIQCFVLTLLMVVFSGGIYAQTTIDLNQVNGGMRIVGEVSGDEAGGSIHAADLNGDGYSDIIISAPSATAGGRALAGKVYVVLGSATPPTNINLGTQATMVVLGRAAGDQMGNPVNAVDINDDGYDDLVIGAQGANSSEGQVYVIFGQASLPTSIDLGPSGVSADIEINGAAQSDLLGSEITSGDFNSDGVEDLVFSAKDATVSNRVNVGVTYIMYGATSGLPSTVDLATDSVDVKIYGRVSGDRAGQALATLDMDGDGHDDIAIGAASATGGGSRGEAYVVLGGGALNTHIDLLTDADLRVRGNLPFDFLSWDVAGGDLNRDGYDDLIVGTPAVDVGAEFDYGSTYIVYGSASVSGFIDLSSGGTVDVAIQGNEQYASLGWDVAAINYNGDGYDDLIAAAPFASPTGGFFAGIVFGILGQPNWASSIDLSSTSADLSVLGDDPSDFNGINLAAGDINGDGVDDLLIAASGAAGSTGEVYMVLGVPPYLEVSVTSTSASYGQPLTLSVNIDSTSGMLLAESAMSISFNRDLLTFTGLGNSGTLTNSWTLGSTTAIGNSDPIDTLKVTAVNTGTPVTTKGVFLHLNFFVNKLRNAITAPVTLVRLTFNGGEPGWNQTSAGQITLLGNDGIVESTVVSEPGDTVGVRVNDIDLNIDSLGVEIFSATLQNSRTGESEVIVITEQSFNDNVFFGKLPTVFGAGAGANDDGTMNAQAGDTLFVQYDDPLSAAGPVNTLLDTHQVVVLGDADGSGMLQAFDGALILSHAAGHALLTGRDSLVANLDANAPYGSITAFDAALAIQRRLGMIARFPVQESSSANHPQPETSNNAKPVISERFLALQSQADFVSVQLEDRSEIIAADLVLEGVEGRVEMAADMDLFEMVYHNAEDGLHVSFAGPRPLNGNGELFRIYPIDAKAQVQKLSGTFNGGRIVARLHGAQSLVAQPLRFALHNNVPNPFNAETLIRFDLPSDELASLDVFNTLGQKVRTLVQGRLDAGSHELRWDSRDESGKTLASGVYFYRLVAGERVQTQRMMLVK